jgi:nucleotide-binding universal stress UspA family protein
MVRKVLVGTDTSASADLAVGAAADLARACAAPLVVLYVKPELDSREVFAPAGSASPADPSEYLEEVGRRFEGLEVATRQVPGDPATTICSVAEDEGADVIVVGNRGLHGRRRWLIGSIPQVVLQHAPCSVMVVDTRAAQ